MNKYFVYCRKSSEQEDRQMLSIESQSTELKEIANKINLQVEILSEAKSAKQIGRPVFNEMLERIERGEGNGILVWHPDRISRNPFDSARIIDLLDSGKLLEVLTPTQKFTNTPIDKFMLGFLMMQAKLENDNKGVNVKRGLKTKAELGWLPSGAKPGYMNDRYELKGNKKIMRDPIRFSLIRKAWDCMLTGTYTVPMILKLLNEDWGYRTTEHKKLGLKPITRSHLYRVFSDPFYYGEFEFPVKSGNWYEGKHEPMITKEEFDKVQILLGRNGRPRPKTNIFDFTGLIKCGECNAAVTAETKVQIICPNCKEKFSVNNKSACPKCSVAIEEMNKPKILRYVYYHCTKRKNPNCTQKSVTLKDLETQFDGILSRIQISDRFKDWAIKYLNEINIDETLKRKAIYRSIDDSIKDINNELDNLLALKISPQNADGKLLSNDEYRISKEKLITKRNDLMSKQNATNKSQEGWMMTAEKTFDFACNARHWFANGDRQTKREILAGLGSNLILKDKTVRIDLQKPLQFIETAVDEEPSISQMFEPKEKPITVGQLEDTWTKNPRMLRG